MGDDLVLWSGEGKELGQWTSTAADGSSVALSIEPGERGAALRIDFNLVGPTSWAIARRERAAVLPKHYVVVLRLRGDAPVNQLQFKLVDPRPDFKFPHETQALALRKASLEFAWGPASGGEPERIGAVEFALAAGSGGSGTVWIEELRIEPRDPAAALPQGQTVAASSCMAGHEPERVLEEDENSCWRSDSADRHPWIQLDLGRSCEWGGLVVDFAGSTAAPSSRLLASEDGARWTLLAEDRGGTGSRRWLRTSDGEGRFARIEFPPGSAPAVVRVAPAALELAVSPARYIAAAAREERRGLFPRHLRNEQAYWAVVGADGDERKGLLSEDGALEVDAESFSIEPFLWTEGRLATWADVERRVGLAGGHLPVPSVEWEAGSLRLRITAFAAGAPGSSTLVGRYEIESTASVSRRVRLFLAIRPFQVNPAWQSLNLVGGVAPVTRIERTADTVRVNDARTVFSVSRPDAFGAARSEEGLRELATGRMPARERADDPVGFAVRHGARRGRSRDRRRRGSVSCRYARARRGPLPRGSGGVGGSALGRDRRSLARAARSRTDRAAARRRALLGESPGFPCLDLREPRGAAHPARAALLPPLVDPRRYAHRDGARRDGLRRRGPRLSALVRAVPARGWTRALRRGPPWNRSGRRTR
jgi:hypothetical protein